MKLVSALAVLTLAAAPVAAAASDLTDTASAIGMLRLAVNRCDTPLTQAAIDRYQASAETTYGRLGLPVFEAQQRRAVEMEGWNATQWRIFCTITHDLAISLELL